MTVHPRENWYRDVWLLFISLVCLLALWSLQSTQHQLVTTQHQLVTTQHQLVTTQHQQISGRRFAIGATCAATSAISQAGQDALTSTSQQDGPFERALERLGYPPASVRRAQAKQAAHLYAQHISSAIERQVGGKGADLVRLDGTLDCTRLQQLAKTSK